MRHNLRNTGRKPQIAKMELHGRVGEAASDVSTQGMVSDTLAKFCSPCFKAGVFIGAACVAGIWYVSRR